MKYYCELLDDNYNELGASLLDCNNKSTAIRNALDKTKELNLKHSILAINSMRTSNLLDVIDIDVEQD